MKRIAICGGEPAGVGVELCLRLAKWQHHFSDVALFVIADNQLLKERAKELGQAIEIRVIDKATLSNRSQLNIVSKQAKENSQLLVYPIAMNSSSIAGELSVQNVPYVLSILSTAHQLCKDKVAEGVLTLPIHKGVINTHLQSFSSELFYGHTEYFQQVNNCQEVVMMLACEDLSVALATTHIPLSQVAQAINQDLIEKKLRIIHQYYCIQKKHVPKIAVLGLNPHAGEGGYMGTEEIDIIQPVINKLRQQGFLLSDVMSADTAFIQPNLKEFDCFFGMYHDQVLPIIKHLGFHRTTNITLGLPYPRTSVDHGTALDIAGTNQADDGSFRYSIEILQRLLTNGTS